VIDHTVKAQRTSTSRYGGLTHIYGDRNTNSIVKYVHDLVRLSCRNDGVMPYGVGISVGL